MDYCILYRVCCVTLGSKHKHSDDHCRIMVQLFILKETFVHSPNTYWKPILCEGNTIVSKNGCGLWHHSPYSIVTIKIEKRNKENMRIHFILIHWMLYSQFIQMFIKSLLNVTVFTLLGTFWDLICLHAGCLACSQNNLHGRDLSRGN